MDSRLIEDFSIPELNENLTRLLKMFSKTDFLFPTIDNIRTYGTSVYQYPLATPVSVSNGNVTIKSIAKSSTANVNYTISLQGTAPLLATATKTALYGAVADQTNAVILLIEVPSLVASDILYNGDAITADDLLVIGSRAFLINVRGLFDDSGIKAAADTIYIQYGAHKVVYEFNYTSLTLETA